MRECLCDVLFVVPGAVFGWKISGSCGRYGNRVGGEWRGLQRVCADREFVGSAGKTRGVFESVAAAEERAGKSFEACAGRCASADSAGKRLCRNPTGRGCAQGAESGDDATRERGVDSI